MYRDAYKCNACGYISTNAGTHCNASMVPVVVSDNVLSDNRGGSTAPTVIIREVAVEKQEETPWEAWEKVK